MRREQITECIGDITQGLNSNAQLVTRLPAQVIEPARQFPRLKASRFERLVCRQKRKASPRRLTLVLVPVR